MIAGVEAVSSMTTAAWPPCVYNSQPHKPSGLSPAQIIPANGRSSPLIFRNKSINWFFSHSVLGNVVVQLFQVCKANKIQVWTMILIFFKKWYFTIHWLVGCRWVHLQSSRDWWMLSACKSLSPSLSTRPARSQRTCHLLKSHFLLRYEWGFLTLLWSLPLSLSLLPLHIQLPSQLLNQDMTYPPPPHAPSSISSSAFHSSLDDLSSLELPHSCSNGSDDQLESLLVSAPHLWLCDGSLLCLLEPRHPDNLSAFQVLLYEQVLIIKNMYTV